MKIAIILLCYTFFLRKISSQIIINKNYNNIIDKLLKFIKDNNLIDSVQFTGKGINDLGQYDSCLDNKKVNKNRYLTLNIVKQNNLIQSSSVGICVNYSTTAEKLQEQMIRFIMENNLQKVLDPNWIQVIEPLSKKLENKEWEYQIVVVIYSLLAFISLLAIYNWLLQMDSHQNIIFKIIACFNPITNYKLAISIEQKSDEYSLEFFQGIRTISSFAIVFGHEYLIRAFQSVNSKQFNDFFSSFQAVLVNASCFSIDVFFYLSGFFFAISCLPKNIKFMKIILNRYFRLVFLYFFMILFYWQLLPRLAEGPLMPILLVQTKKCSDFWTNILFINNFFKRVDETCYVLGWYLSNDFQIFIISLLPLSLYKSGYVTLAKLLIYLLIITQILTSFIINFKYKVGLLLYSSYLTSNNNVQDDLYTKPYHRWSVYFIGFIIGIYFIEMKQFNIKFNINLAQQNSFDKRYPLLLNISIALRRYFILKLFCYIFGIFLMLFFSLYIYNYKTSNIQWSMISQYYFNVMARPSFVIGMVICFLPCLLQQSNYLKYIFGNYFFQFIGKFSFSIYLIHYQVIQLSLYSTRQNIYFQFSNFFRYFLQDFIITLFFSIIASIFIEIPFSKIQKIMFKRSQQYLIQSNQLSQKLSLSVSNQIEDISVQRLNKNLLDQQFNKI